MTKVWTVRITRSVTYFFDQTILSVRDANRSYSTKSSRARRNVGRLVGQVSSDVFMTFLRLRPVCVVRSWLLKWVFVTQTLSSWVIHVPFSALLFLGKLCKTCSAARGRRREGCRGDGGGCSCPGEPSARRFWLPGKHHGSPGTRLHGEAAHPETPRDTDLQDHCAEQQRRCEHTAAEVLVICLN